MSILILTPLVDELDLLIQAFSAMGNRSIPRTIGKQPAYSIEALDMFLAQGGHGKTQFAVQTQYLLDVIPHASLVICAGAAGGIDPSVNIGDIVVATATVEHDYHLKFNARPLPSFNASAHHLELLRTLEPPSDAYRIHFGKIASGDEDVITRGRARELREQTDALAVAWEGAGGARAAGFMKIPYLEIRGLTDVADNDSPVVFDENLKLVMPRIASLIAALRAKL